MTYLTESSILGIFTGWSSANTRFIPAKEPTCSEAEHTHLAGHTCTARLQRCHQYRITQ